MAQRREKVAEIAADALRTRILGQRLLEGTRLGSQAELIEEMQLSRGSAREAMRLLEHQGLVHIKPGPSGGIYVAIPDTRTVINAAANYLGMVGSDPATLFPARVAIESALTRDAAERVGKDPTLGAALQDALAVETDLIADGLAGSSRAQILAVNHQSFILHVEVAHAAGNPPLALCGEILLNLGEFEGSRLSYDPDAIMTNHRAHTRIVEAILAGDAQTAEQRMRRHIAATFDWVVDARKQAAQRARRSGSRRAVHP